MVTSSCIEPLLTQTFMRVKETKNTKTKKKKIGKIGVKKFLFNVISRPKKNKNKKTLNSILLQCACSCPEVSKYRPQDKCSPLSPFSCTETDTLSIVDCCFCAGKTELNNYQRQCDPQMLKYLLPRPLHKVCQSLLLTNQRAATKFMYISQYPHRLAQILFPFRTGL